MLVTGTGRTAVFWRRCARPGRHHRHWTKRGQFSVLAFVSQHSHCHVCVRLQRHFSVGQGAVNLGWVFERPSKPAPCRVQFCFGWWILTFESLKGKFKRKGKFAAPTSLLSAWRIQGFGQETDLKNQKIAPCVACLTPCFTRLALYIFILCLAILPKKVGT